MKLDFVLKLVFPWTNEATEGSIHYYVNIFSNLRALQLHRWNGILNVNIQYAVNYSLWKRFTKRTIYLFVVSIDNFTYDFHFHCSQSSFHLNIVIIKTDFLKVALLLLYDFRFYFVLNRFVSFDWLLTA